MLSQGASLSEAPTVSEDMVEVFRTAANQQIAALDANLREIGAAPDLWNARKEEARDIVHNLKGQGASFGYPLITSIGQSLLDFLRGLEQADGRAMKVAIAHVHALRTVLEKDIAGTGGSRGESLVKRLRELTAP